MSCLQPRACDEVAGMAAPPQAVKNTVRVLMMAFPPPKMKQHKNPNGTHWNKEPSEWERAKAFLRGPDIIKRMCAYDKDNLPRRTHMMMQDAINPEKFGCEFRSDVIASKSLAAAQLCQWVNGFFFCFF